MPLSDATLPDPSSAPPVVTVIVVSYNTRAMTLACLDSLFAETRAPLEAIVIDNASGDGSAEAIAARFPPDRAPRLRLVAERENHGFARANNLAARMARGDYLLLLNPDTLVLDGAVDRLLAFARARPEAGIWGGRTLFGDGRLNPLNCARRMSLWTLFARAAGLTGLFPRSPVFNAEEYGGWARDTERSVDIVSGCFLMIRRETWERLGGFDPAFVMYGEEADLCLRARALGCRPVVTPEARIVHHGGASEPARADKVVRLFRAKATLIRRHFPPLARGPGLRLFALWPLTRAWVERLRGRSAGAWAEVWARRAEWLPGYAGSAPP
jgi:GT2 family glycosyltransferase